MPTNFVYSEIGGIRNTVIRSLRNCRVDLIEYSQMPICGLICVVPISTVIKFIVLFEIGVFGPLEDSFVMWLHEHHIYFLGHSEVCHNIWELYEVFLYSVLNRV